MKTKGIFITGTDTGVGKTAVAAAIALHLKKAGVRVGVLKPVTSGALVLGDKLVSEDAELLRWASGCAAPDQDIAPYVFRLPLAPSEAAAREGRSVELAPICDAFGRLAASHDFLIVEGAGGLLVPLADNLLVADLAARLALPLLIVARPNLGTVNHSLMTCECAKARSITVKGIIINGQPEHPDEAEEYASRVIGRYAGVPVPAILSRCHDNSQRNVIKNLADQIGEQPLAATLCTEI